MDETQDTKPHPGISGEHAPSDAVVRTARGEALSIWFFCGILTLGYGTVLVIQALLEHFRVLGQHPAGTVLANHHPTFWWGICLFLFGAFYTVKFRPGNG